MNIEEIMISPVLTNDNWRGKAIALYNEIAELYQHITNSFKFKETRAKILSNLLSRAYYDEQDRLVMRCDFDKLLGCLESVYIYVDNQGNHNLNALFHINCKFSDLLRGEQATELMNFEHISIFDKRDDADIYRLDLFAEENGELSISVHEIRLEYNGKKVNAFYSAEGVLSSTFSSGFNMLTTAKIMMLETTKYKGE